MNTSVSKSSAKPKNSLTASGKYLRFTLRLNLIRYLVWIAIIVGMLAYVAVFYKSMDINEIIKLFESLGSNPGMTAMVGNIGSATLGGAVWLKIWMTLAMTLAIGMVFQVTHGARYDEENGRTELFRSRPFGIHSTLTSVVGGSLLLCLVIGVLTVFVSHALGLDPEGAGITGSVVLGLSFIACGWVGVGVGALTNQLSSSASLANSTGSVVIVFFYVLRMIGDMGENAAVWLSPIGWAERMAPWSDNKWWLFIPAVVLTAVLIAIALFIESRRDYGSGVLEEKKGKSEASSLIRHSWGLILHLYKGSIIGWTVGMILAGLMFGSVAKQMVDMLSGLNISILQGKVGLDTFLSFLMCFIGMIATVLPMQIMTGLRSDEAKGLTEAQLSKRLARSRLILERLAVSFVLTVILLLLGGLSIGASYGAVAGDMSQIWKLALHALAYLPGIMTVIGVVVLLFGFVPRFTLPVSWFLYGAMYFEVLLGNDALPKWFIQITPFTGTLDIMSTGGFKASVLGFAAAAVVFAVLGIIGFRKRDVPK